MGTIETRVTRTQWAIGQDGFQTGIIDFYVNETHGRYTYVFDCGTEARQTIIENRIRQFDQQATILQTSTHPTSRKNTIATGLHSRLTNLIVNNEGNSPTKSKIDALYISHFDLDHISGIPALCDGREVTECIIPTTTVHERFLCLASNLFRTDKNRSTDTITDERIHEISEWIWKFYEQPELALKLMINEHIKVRESPYAEANNQRTAHQNKNETLEEREIYSKTTHITSTTRTPVGTIKTQSDRTQIHAATPNNTSIPIWELRSHTVHDTILSKVAEQFISNLIERNLITQGEDITHPNAFKEFYVSSNLNELKQIGICLKEAINDFKKHYKITGLISGMTVPNAFSLILYSGTPSKLSIMNVQTKSIHAQSTTLEIHNRTGWLNCSDAPIGRHSEPLSTFTHLYADIFGQITTFLPPHHGSDKDWSPDLLSPLSMSRPPHMPKVVIPAHSRRYGHPGVDLIRYLQHNHCATFIVNNEPANTYCELQSFKVQYL